MCCILFDFFFFFFCWDRRPIGQRQSIGGHWPLDMVLSSREQIPQCRESNYQSLPWDLGISPPSSRSLGSSRWLLLACLYFDLITWSYSWNFLEFQWAQSIWRQGTTDKKTFRWDGRERERQGGKGRSRVYLVLQSSFNWCGIPIFLSLSVYEILLFFTKKNTIESRGE